MVRIEADEQPHHIVGCDAADQTGTCVGCRWWRARQREFAAWQRWLMLFYGVHRSVWEGRGCG